MYWYECLWDFINPRTCKREEKTKKKLGLIKINREEQVSYLKRKLRRKKKTKYILLLYFGLHCLFKKCGDIRGPKNLNHDRPKKELTAE